MDQLKENYKTLVDILQSNLTKSLQTYFKLSPIPITKSEIINLIGSRFSNVQTLLHDEKFYTTTWENWKQIIEFDWTNKHKYITDTFDCDNFSASFCSRMAEIFGMNTAGRFTCTVTTSQGEKISHRATLIIAFDENGELAPYVFETQNDRYFKVTDPKQAITIPNNYQKAWTYNGILTEFN